MYKSVQARDPRKTCGNAMGAFRSSQWAPVSDDLEIHIIKQLVSRQQIEIAAVSIPLDLNPSEVRSQYRSRRGTESDDHRFLKACSGLWLRSIGAKDVRYEPSCAPVLCDVASPDLSMAVECGNTQPRRMLMVLAADWRFLMVPYWDSRETSVEAYLYVRRNTQ